MFDYQCSTTREGAFIFALLAIAQHGALVGTMSNFVWRRWPMRNDVNMNASKWVTFCVVQGSGVCIINTFWYCNIRYKYIAISESYNISVQCFVTSTFFFKGTFRDHRVTGTLNFHKI